MNEDIEYRTAGFRPLPAPEDIPTKDEIDYSTLSEVEGYLTEAMGGLYKDFNAFELSDKTSDEVVLEIQARKVAYNLLLPAIQSVQTAIERVKASRKER